MPTKREKVTFASLAKGPSVLKRKEVTVKEWGGGRFFILEVSGTTHQALVRRIEEIKGGDPEPQGSKAAELASTWLNELMVDQDGEKPPMEFLMEQPLRLLMDLCNQALEFNGLTDEVQKVVEKNSESQGSAPSGE